MIGILSPRGSWRAIASVTNTNKYHSLQLWNKRCVDHDRKEVVWLSKMAQRTYRIVFCGQGHFLSSFEYTKEYLQSESLHLIFQQCSYDNLEERLKGFLSSSSAGRLSCEENNSH